MIKILINKENIFLNKKTIYAFFLTMIYLIQSILCGFLNPAFSEEKQLILKERTSDALVSLYARSGLGEYYTLYPDGLEKEEANIGGFISSKLDPIEENIYFYDPILKIISKINLKSGKVGKVIGKPRSTTNTDYLTPVSFNDASLNYLKDFTFDKYGNIYILYQIPKNTSSTNSVDQAKILKASIKDQKIIEIVDVNDYFKPTPNISNIYEFNFSLNGITSNPNGDLFLYGNTSYKQNNTTNPYPGTSPVVLKFNSLSKSGEFYAARQALSQTGINFKLLIPSNDSNDINFINYNSKLSIKGLFIDNDGNLFLSVNDTVDTTTWYSYLYKQVSNADGSLKFENYIGNKTTNKDLLGDGGSTKDAYCDLNSTKFIVNDKDRNLYVADLLNKRVRKIFQDSGLIVTIVGGGTESILFNESKSVSSIGLNTPSTVLIDRENKLYVIEKDRILVVNNLLIRDDSPIQTVNIASLAITKIANKEIINPKGDINIPDLKLDYSFAGTQNIEVKGKFIPEGTNIKLLDVSDLNNSINLANGKLQNGSSIIPINIEAGKSTIIKAESDPFIPAPGVYLPENAPQITPGTYPNEPINLSPRRDDVVKLTKNSLGDKTGNLLPVSTWFNFSKNSGWLNFLEKNVIKLASVLDPDNLFTDAYEVLITDANTLYLNSSAGLGKVTYSVWMRSDTGNFNVPVAVTNSCPNFQNPASGTGCYVPQYFSSALLTNTIANANFAVTPEWKKFTITADSPFAKMILIGNTNCKNQKFYIWGERLESTP